MRLNFTQMTSFGLGWNMCMLMWKIEQKKTGMKLAVWYKMLPMVISQTWPPAVQLSGHFNLYFNLESPSCLPCMHCPLKWQLQSRSDQWTVSSIDAKKILTDISKGPACHITEASATWFLSKSWNNVLSMVWIYRTTYNMTGSQFLIIIYYSFIGKWLPNQQLYLFFSDNLMKII